MHLILVFVQRCQHCCHARCLRNEFGENANWSCPVCSKKNIARRASSADDQPSDSSQTEVNTFTIDSPFFCFPNKELLGVLLFARWVNCLVSKNKSLRNLLNRVLIL